MYTYIRIKMYTHTCICVSTMYKNSPRKTLTHSPRKLSEKPRCGLQRQHHHQPYRYVASTSSPPTSRTDMAFDTQIKPLLRVV